jgi:collagenase-like PrtC family protease
MDVKNKLSLGPLLFNWSEDKIRDFYFKIADEAPIETIYVGEVVCAKRLAGKDYLPDIIERLDRAGKQVIISGLMLIMDDRDRQINEGVTEMASDYLVEANDISAVSLLKGESHAIGPFINIYNEATLKYHEKCGANRFSLPPELPKNSLKILAAAASSEMEVQVFGRLPLAISARCYHARAHKLHKDGCQYICDKDPDGLVVDTVEGQNFLTINGLQTLSFTYCNLMAELTELSQMNIHNFRLSPHDTDMVKVADIYRDCLDQKTDFQEANDLLEDELFMAEFSNGFYHNAAGVLKI